MSESVLARFLNQTCTIEKYDPETDVTYGDARFLPPVTVPCRKESFFRMVQNEDQQIVKSSSRYFIGPDTPVEAWQDKVDGRLVLDVQDYVWLDGSKVGYEVVV